MHQRWKQYSNALKAAYCKPNRRKKAGILADATTAHSVEMYAIPTILCLGFSSYSACAENGITSNVPSGFTKSFVGSGLVSLRRSGFFVGGGSSVATRLVVVGWRCVAGVLMPDVVRQQPPRIPVARRYISDIFDAIEPC